MQYISIGDSNMCLKNVQCSMLSLICHVDNNINTHCVIISMSYITIVLLDKRIYIKDTYFCTFCEKESETIEHILWECEVVQDLLNDFDS